MNIDRGTYTYAGAVTSANESALVPDGVGTQMTLNINDAIIEVVNPGSSTPLITDMTTNFSSPQWHCAQLNPVFASPARGHLQP